MRVLILTQNLDTGGVQKSVAMLANALCKFYDCTLLLFEDNKPMQYSLREDIEVRAIATLEVDICQPDIGREIFSYRRSELSKVVDSLEPSLIFSFEDYHNILSLEIDSSAKRIVSCRISLQNFYTASSKIHLLDSDFYFQHIRKLYKKADAVVCVSQFIKNEVLDLCGDINAINLYNGVDQQRLIQGQDKIIEVGFDYILHVGRLHPQKGQEDLIRAYAMIHKQIPQKLVIIGDGTSKDELMCLVETFALAEKVIFLGNINEPYHYMKKAKFCIIPSHQEGFSNTVLEMMFLSTLLASKYNGYNEILHDYGNLFDIGDVEKLAALILKYSLDTEALSGLKHSQFIDVQPFTIEKSMQNYIELIGTIING